MILDHLFPLLKTSGYRIISSPDKAYNCIAWAAGIQNQFWWPVDGYWPPSAPRELTLAAFIAVYVSRGYVPCDDGSLEVGYEKVAIYLNGSIPTHAARQLSSGKWTSKLGSSHDIEHNTPEGLFSMTYGDRIGAYLKRSIKRERKRVLKRKKRPRRK